MDDWANITMIGQEGGHSIEEQLALLAEVTQGFASSLNISETLRTTIDRLMEYLDAEAVSIFLLEEDGTELVCRQCAGPVDIARLKLDPSEGIVGRTVRENICHMVRDVRKDPDFAESVDLGTGFYTRSILCAPLTVRGVCIGALELLNKRTGDGLFDEQDRNLATALASSAALAIHNARMSEALLSQERMRKELELAREIQQGLLPAAGNENFPVSGLNIPAWEVSGDFFDFLQVADGRIYFNLADVSGKGMNAALLMAKTSSLLRCLSRNCQDPGELLQRVNEEVCATASHGMFVTIVSGFIEPDNNIIRFANAGHQPPLYYHNGVFEEIPALAPPIGVLPDTLFPESTVPLYEGSLYLFTDGVTEALVDNGQPLNVAGLKKLIESMSEVSMSKRLENIVAEIRKPGERQRDDITMMIIEGVKP